MPAPGRWRGLLNRTAAAHVEVSRIRTTAAKLCLPHLAEALTHYAQRAEKSKLGYLDFLELALSEEIAVRAAVTSGQHTPLLPAAFDHIIAVDLPDRCSSAPPLSRAHACRPTPPCACRKSRPCTSGRPCAERSLVVLGSQRLKVDDTKVHPVLRVPPERVNYPRGGIRMSSSRIRSKTL
ncbi:ATP-binding protein [Nonomuraea angiospora]|uniref:ATP-binding protein n=1 Tax=Nonomuraea angiospora TaxID=46172 RepID=UPI0033DE3949